MTDREHLMWIHARLEDHGDDRLVDYLHRLRDIIAMIPANQHSSPVCCNSLDDLRNLLHKREESNCNIGLDKRDQYPGCVIPDCDVETTLKVIRSLRNHAVTTGDFDLDMAVILSHAHRVIVEAVQEVMKAEKEENASQS